MTDAPLSPSFEEYVLAHGSALVRLARLLTGDPHRAEDLTQDVLARAYPRWQRVLSADHPDQYLRRMMINLNTSWWRRLSNREVRVPEHTEIVDHRDLGAESAERMALWEQVAALPPRQRAVVALRYYEDLDDRQIAEILECSPITVRVHAARGLTAIRERLARADEALAENDLEQAARATAVVDAPRLAGEAARTGRRMRTARRSVVAAIIALLGTATTVAYAAFWGGAPLLPGGNQATPGVDQAAAFAAPPVASGHTSRPWSELVGAEPATFHFVLGGMPRRVATAQWSIRESMEEASIRLGVGEGDGRFDLRLTRGTAPAGFILSSEPARSTRVGEHPASIRSAPGAGGDRVELTWQPADGVTAALSADGLTTDEVLSIARGVRMAERRCTLPARFGARPVGATIAECSYSYDYATPALAGPKVGARMVFDCPDSRITVTTSVSIGGGEAVPTDAPTHQTSQFLPYVVLPDQGDAKMLHIYGPVDVLVSATGAYAGEDSMVVVNGLIPVRTPTDTGSWPEDPLR